MTAMRVATVLLFAFSAGAIAAMIFLEARPWICS